MTVPGDGDGPLVDCVDQTGAGDTGRGGACQGYIQGAQWWEGEVRVATAEVGNEVIPVGLDGAFGGVCAMQVRRNELEIDAGIA